MQIFSRVALVLVALLSSLATAKEQRPNVVFILTDDQAPWALGVSGHPNANTPHLDKLFKQGMYLKKAYVVTPVCSPSRTLGRSQCKRWGRRGPRPHTSQCLIQI